MKQVWKAPLVGLVVCLSFAGVFGPLIASSLRSGTARDARLEELTSRIGRLEDTLLRRLDDLKSGLGAPGQREIVSEGAERDLLAEISQQASGGDADALRDALERYLDGFGGSPNAPLIRKMLDETSVVGSPVPDSWSILHVFQGPADAGLDGDGIVVLLFWELWCPHCKDEVPRMQQLHMELKERGVAMVGMTEVNGQASDDQVEEFIRGAGIDYPVVKINAGLKARFKVSGVPAAAVIGNGRILWRGHPARLSGELLERWLPRG